jgi:choloylglycine hydrolase
LFETKYPDISGKEVINALEWIQYQLDNSATFNEVIVNCNKVNIDPMQVVPVHYFICDSSGNMGVVEFLNGEIVVVRGKNVSIPVCSNMPYQQSLISIKAYKTFGGNKDIPEQWDNIPDIIAIANSMILNYKITDNPVDYSFKILNAVDSDTRTQWSIVFDIKNRTINYKTLNNKAIRILNLDDYNFACGNEIKILDIQKSKEGIISPENFNRLTYDFYYNYKSELISIYKANIKGFPDFPESYVKTEVDYVMNRKCN